MWYVLVAMPKYELESEVQKLQKRLEKHKAVMAKSRLLTNQLEALIKISMEDIEAAKKRRKQK